MTFPRRLVMLFRSRKGTIRSSIALLVLLSLLRPSPAIAANPDLETVLTGSRQRVEKLDYRVTGRLTRVEGNGTRTNYKFVAKAHWFPDGLLVLCEISGLPQRRRIWPADIAADGCGWATRRHRG